MDFNPRIFFYTAPTAIFIAFLVKLLIIKHNNNSKRKQIKLPPSPPSLPIIGHLHLLREPIHRTLRSLSDSYGKVILLRCGSRNILLVSSASAAEECFTKNDIVFANRPKTLSGKHIHYNSSTIAAADYGDYWRSLRRVLTMELVSSSRLAVFSPLRENEVQLLVEHIGKTCGNNGSAKIDLTSKFTEISFNVMTMVLVGKRFYGESVEDAEEAKRIREVIKEGVKLSGSSNVGDFFPLLQRFDFFGTKKKMVRLMEKYDKFLQDLINERRGVSSENNNKYVVDSLLVLQQADPISYTDDIIKGIILILLVAATDTALSTMEWAMSLMLNHPRVMKRVKAEIDSITDQDNPLTEQDLAKLKYLHNVINETHRLFTPVPLLVPHESSEHCVVDGYDIPQGTMLFVNAWAIHRDPEVWDDPTSFVPERFESWKEESERLIPFGLGRRGCPGAGWANRVVWLTLGSLIQSFDWVRISDEQVDLTEGIGLSMPKATPLEAICIPRQNSFH